MSSAAAAGSPFHNHSRSLNIGETFGSANGGTGMNLAADSGHKTRKRIYPHIEDLLAARPEINVQAPIRSILKEGITFARQASTHIDFGRPDVALQEYMKSYIVAVEILPRHKDYPELQGDRGELHRSYGELKQRINSQHEKFEMVKETIKRDNLNNGTRPLGDHGIPNTTRADNAGAQTAKSHTRSHSTQEVHINGDIVKNGGPYSITKVDKEADKESTLPTAFIKRKPPPMPPKPAGLHSNSNSLKHNSNPPQETGPADLAARFANLRAGPPPGKPVQDPRVRTRPIEMPKVSDYISHARSSSPQSFSYPYSKPLGPRDMPSAPSGPPRPQKLPLKTDIPAMPRAPDATYSPARNLNTPAGIDPPRSTPRSMYSLNGRSGSMVSLNGPTPLSNSDGNPYFPTIPKLPVTKDPVRAEPDLPDSIEITAEELTNYLRMGSRAVRILLVDIRPREQFDEGHIMSQSIICVEPVSLHKDISAEEIVEALILSPENEEKLFDQRNEFDMVVFYDNSSTSTVSGISPRNSEVNPLDDFSKAVYEYAYSKRLKRRPVLLKGGLAAWTDLCGEQSLQTSQTVSFVKDALGQRKFVRAGPPTRRAPLAPMLGVNVRKYNSRPLSEKEEQHWAAELDNNQQLGPFVDQDGQWDEATFVKTTDDFFRRFPEPSAIKESMTSRLPQQPNTTISHPQGLSKSRHDGPGSFEYRSFDEMNAMFPPMPTRPPLARARNTGPVAASNTRPQGVVDFTKTPVLTNRSGRTGLANFGSTCYMSAAIQCLCATEMFATYILSGEWENLRPPMKLTETSAPPQLMTKNLAFLFRHFFQGTYGYVVPRTLRDYVFRVHSKGVINEQQELVTFGGSQQHDAGEFLSWFLTIMDDEQNPNRAVMLPQRTEAEETAYDESLRVLSIAEAAARWWNDMVVPISNSRIQQMFAGMGSYTTTCQICRRSWQRYDKWDWSKPIAISNTRFGDSLEAALGGVIRPETNIRARCDFNRNEAHPAGDVTRQYGFTRLPPILSFTFGRIIAGDRGLQKILTSMTFPQVLNMDPYMARNFHPNPNLPREMVAPFLYDCYAVMFHRGQAFTSGHYYVKVKDWRDDRWFRIDDRVVSETDWASTQNSPESYMVFYKRRD